MITDHQKQIRLVLPYPISANRYWISFYATKLRRVCTGPSTEAKAYKNMVRGICIEAGIKNPINGRVHLDIKLFPKRPQDYAKRMQKRPNDWDDDVQCLDLDNVNKVLFDALKGIAIDDDKWVRKITAERCEPDGDARVELIIRPIEKLTPQGSLI